MVSVFVLNKVMLQISRLFIMLFLIHQIFSLACDWSKHVTTEYSQLRLGKKTRENPRIFRNFQNCARCEKDLKSNKHSLHLGQKYAMIFVLEDYLFLKA